MIAKEAAKRALSLGRQPVNRARFARAVRQPGPHKVNVGAGRSRLDGWLNTDVSWLSRMHLDLMKTWPVPPDSVGWVYADNVIEHFTLPAARTVLRHAFEALRPGGGIRLVTPDVGRIAQAYLHDPDLTAAHLDRHRRHGYFAEHPVDLLRVTFAEAGHHVGYCFDCAALSAEVEAAGFVDVHRCDVGDSSDPDFKDIENPRRSEPTLDRLTLIVEGRKPG